MPSHIPVSLAQIGFPSAITFAASGLARAGGDFTPHDLALLDRLSWGVNASSAEHLRRVGVEKWLQEQLHPLANVVLPDAVKAQIEAMPDVHKFPFDIAVAFEAQAKSANQVVDPDQKKAAQQVYQAAMNDRARQAAARTILHALYAPDQLRERIDQIDDPAAVAAVDRFRVDGPGRRTLEIGRSTPSGQRTNTRASQRSFTARCG